MYCHPWEFHDHGVERVLADLERCGIDAVQLSFNYHVASFISPRNPKRRIYAGELGSLHFHPSALRTADWPCEPPVSSEVTGERYMPELLEELAGRGMAVVAWVIYLYNHALARRRPDLAIQNAYGDTSGAQLCPTNPSVRAYVDALTTAVIGHAPLTGLVAESLSFLPYDYGLLNLKSAVSPSATAGRLLSLCFCTHCRARADAAHIDSEGLRRTVVDALEQEWSRLPEALGWAAPGSSAVEALREHSTDLRGYLEVRAGTAASLQRAVLTRALEAGLRTGTSAVGSHDDHVTGVPNDAVRDLRSEYRFEVLPDHTPEAVAAAVAGARAGAGPTAEIYALAQLSNFTTESSFRSTLEAVTALGIRRFRFYEYGLLSESQLSWICDAQELWTGADLGTDDSGFGRDPG